MIESRQEGEQMDPSDTEIQVKIKGKKSKNGIIIAS